ncbi:MAG TPA: hypothetical protein VK528_11985 [Flavobacterium sp.]|nr:hypothetical protein [Flavobacterium sp.]
MSEVKKNKQLRQPPVSGSVLLEASKYYKRIFEHHQSFPPGIYYFKCEKTDEKGAHGIELYVHDSEFFHANPTAHHITGNWDEISKDQFLFETIPFIAQFQQRFS